MRQLFCVTPCCYLELEIESAFTLFLGLGHYRILEKIVCTILWFWIFVFYFPLHNGSAGKTVIPGAEGPFAGGLYPWLFRSGVPYTRDEIVFSIFFHAMPERVGEGTPASECQLKTWGGHQGPAREMYTTPEPSADGEPASGGASTRPTRCVSWPHHPSPWEF